MFILGKYRKFTILQHCEALYFKRETVYQIVATVKSLLYQLMFQKSAVTVSFFCNLIQTANKTAKWVNFVPLFNVYGFFRSKNMRMPTGKCSRVIVIASDNSCRNLYRGNSKIQKIRQKCILKALQNCNPCGN